MILPSANPDTQKTVTAVHDEEATVLFLDRDFLKILRQEDVAISSPKLRQGILKIGSGWAFHQEPEKFKDYSGLPLVTVGRALPKRTSW